MPSGESSAASNLITLVLTLSHRLVHLISWMRVLYGSEWILSNAFQTLFKSRLTHGSEEEVALNLNSISIECSMCVAFFFIQLSSLWWSHVPTNLCVLPCRHDFLCCCGCTDFTQDVERAERMFKF